MRVLFVAVFSPTSTNTAQADGFEKLGHEVIRFNFREMASEVGWDSTCNRLIAKCREEKPDIVVFSKCHEIQLRAWDAIKNTGAKIAYWYMDPMSNYSNDILQRVQHSDIVFCALWDPYQYSLKFNPNSHFLHEGYDHLSNYPVESDWPVKDVSFIGNLRSQKRSDYYNRIGFNIIQNAYGIEHSKAVGSTKINLNFTEGGCSDRVYKVLASKGFLLTDAWPNMNDDFSPGDDFVVFNDADELREKITYYLANDEERYRIAANGYNTVQKFSRINWAHVIIEKTNELIHAIQ